MTGLSPYLAETAIGLAVFYAVYRLLLKNDTHFQASRFYLLASLVVAHALPFVHVTSPFRQTLAPPGTLDDLDSTMTQAAGWGWQQVVFWVYLSGAVFVLLRLGWHLVRLVIATRQQPAVHRAGVRVVYVDDDCPPFSFFRTAFVHRPAAGEDPVLDHVVAHERTHIRQWHSLDILLVQLAAAAQWFNPFIWLFRNALRELHEYLADREVLSRGFNPSAYKRVLFEQHLGARSFEFAHHLRQSQIKRRLAMMTRRSGPWTLCKYLLVLPALALLVVAFAEPQVVAAGSPTVTEPAMLAASVSQPVVLAQDQGKKQKADNGNGNSVDKKKAEADFVKKMDYLEAEFNATSDPDKKKEIKAKMKQLEAKHAELNGGNGGNGGIDMTDPVAIEGAITKISKKLEVLKAKIQETTDTATEEQLQKDAQTIAKKLEILRVKLAELRASR